MNKFGKIIIVVALVIAVTWVISLKSKRSSPDGNSIQPQPTNVAETSSQQVSQPTESTPAGDGTVVNIALTVEVNSVGIELGASTSQPAKSLPRLVDLGAGQL